MHIANSSQIARYSLDWNYTVPQLFSHFSTLPWAVLLDSADAEHPDAKFDLISAWPLATLTTHGNTSEICQQQKQKQWSAADPWQLLRQLLADYFPDSKPTILPFGGGAIGCFGYDLGRKLEQLPDIAADDIAFPQLAVGIYDWALLHDKQTQGWQLLHYAGEAALNATLARLQALLATPPAATTPFTLASYWQPQLSKSEYLEKFQRIQHYLHSGDCYQINLTQRFSTDYQGDEWQAYCALRQANTAPFSAFMRLPQGCALSISPERFMTVTAAGQIQTKPIKGTAPRSDNAAADRQLAVELQQSAKNRAENLMIVDLLRNDIGKIATPGSVTVPSLFALESFPAVHHLVSTVTGQLPDDVTPLTLLRSAFPGGSITGAPKIRAMEIIEELEPSRRNLYCGAIAYISQHGTMDSNIAIRTLVAAEGKLHCWAGGGIVADSDGDAEYQECHDKVSRILPLLQQFKE
ncbi:aminodeoxychorismate synthase component I [Shewanella dokdonensis]|uniref:aminodeoxychorismate synthase n=1 Tax=Shewanella dokdonensis TaxID=712036 RepID=A0ABX8DGT4_9GAMM|nr:aminodeoxychorismate synthase component I [Shewanella dokdonensis]MCL1073117.1 aminodeoxychorismate synthase component I [Shewanella dokdonensis]QVK23002.1 aminodeoxychorismate synthase component I [Shewanella dokdonensis]